MMSAFPQRGSTLFVEPGLVAGTLREGWRRLAEHDTAEADLDATNAFDETDDAPRVRLLRPVSPA